MARSSTSYDVSWFLDMFRSEQLDLDPPYQRNSVWSMSDKRFFIDTIMNNYPAPPVFLHKTLEESGRAQYHVVDGKQRLQTIVDFSLNKIRIPDDFAIDRLRKLRFEDLDPSARASFWNYSLSVELLPDVSPSAVKEIFGRINRNSRKLTPQELRHAKYDGWFINFAEEESNTESWKDLGVVTIARSKRMADVQFISELILVVIDRQIHGFDQDHIDERYAEYEEVDILPDIDVDYIKERVDQVKNFAVAMVNEASNVIEFYKIQGHFYTLWAYLALNQDFQEDPVVVARRYSDFVVDVREAIKVDDKDLEKIESPGVREYLRNFRGASTDIMPRINRLTALTQFMMAEVNEDR